MAKNSFEGMQGAEVYSEDQRSAENVEVIESLEKSGHSALAQYLKEISPEETQRLESDLQLGGYDMVRFTKLVDDEEFETALELVKKWRETKPEDMANRRKIAGEFREKFE